MLLFYKILMGIAAVLGVISLAKTQNKLLRFSVLVLVIGVIWTIIDNQYLGTRFSVYFLGLALFAVYAGINKEFTTEKRSVLLFMSILVLAHGILAVNHLPYVLLFKGLQIISLLVFITKVLPNRDEYKAEMGALAIITTDALIQVISFVMYLLE